MASSPLPKEHTLEAPRLPLSALETNLPISTAIKILFFASRFQFHSTLKQMVMKEQSRQRFDTLDGMRGIAAIFIMLFHYNIQNGYRFFFNAFTAVDFFFILSGFVILHSYGEKLEKGMAVTDYISRRIARLLPLSMFGVLLGFPAFLLLQKASMTDFTAETIWDATFKNMFFIPAFNGNWFILDGAKIVGQLFPTDGPLWSIFFELFASFVFIFFNRLGNKMLALSCLLFLLDVVIFSVWNGHMVGNRMIDFDAGWGVKNFIGGFPRVCFGFTCGMVVYRLIQASESLSIKYPQTKSPGWNAITVYSCLILMLAFPFYLKGFYSIFETSFLAPILVYQGARAQIAGKFVENFSTALGTMSFPIYCMHYPVLLSIKSLNLISSQIHFSNAVAVVLAILTTVLLSYLATQILEVLHIQQKLTHALNLSVIKLTPDWSSSKSHHR